MYLPKHRRLLLFISCIFLAIRGGEATEIENICYNSSLEGFRLNTTVLLAKTVSQRIDCVMDCATEPCCRSINYKNSKVLQNDPNCEMLHNVVYNLSVELLKKNSSYDYVYLFSPQKGYDATCLSMDNFEDVDECAQDNYTCDSNASCINTIGSYTCRCKSGYIGDGKSCKGINCTVKTTAGDCCVFPFYYNMKWYQSCTSSILWNNWCSTTTNYDQDEKWGYCEQN